jgi:hypothetical protein
MTISTTGKPGLVEGLIAIDLAVSSSDVPASGVSVPTRYFFNLTNGNAMIRDEEGIDASSVRAAVVSALEAVEELRAQESLTSNEWQGWRLEIVNASGQAVKTIPLDALSAH